jgi:hypothetical protein
MRWNPSGIVIAIALPFIGYCFGGWIGAGIGATLTVLIQLH